MSGSSSNNNDSVKIDCAVGPFRLCVSVGLLIMMSKQNEHEYAVKLVKSTFLAVIVGQPHT